MEKGNLDDVFNYLSKATIVIPLVIIIIALLLKFNQKSSMLFQTINRQPPTVTTTPDKNLLDEIFKKSATSEAKFNLDGPLVCQTSINSASFSAHIKNKNISVSIEKKDKKENYLVKGDCFYHWANNKFVGDKTCGISSFFPLIETLSSSNLLDLKNLLKLLPKTEMINVISSNEAGLVNIMESCKKKELDEKIFTIPGNILFKNT